MDNILSQNRYVYVVNNPINYADPDGHKAVGSTIKNTASAMAANTRKAAQEAKNRTSKAAETAAGKSGKGAAAVFMAANQITRNEVKGVSQGTTKGVDAAKTGIVAEASADEINRAAQEKAAHSQAKADFVSMPLDALNSAGAWLDKGLTNLAGYIDVFWAGEWVGSAAEWVTQKECAAYNYCINGLQEFLPNSDVERILDGSGLILMGGFKMAGGAFLTFAGALTSYTGIGLGGMAAGTVTGVSGISDIEQGINEIKLGLRNDSTTRTGNYVRDTLYDGNDTIYHLSTGTAAMVGMALRPYVMPQKNPVLAGGEQKDIAKKAAMGVDDAVADSTTTIEQLKEYINHGEIKGNNIISQIDDNTQIIFRNDTGEFAHPINSHGYSTAVNHYNIEIQTKTPSGRWKSKWSYHIILDNTGNVIGAFD